MTGTRWHRFDSIASLQQTLAANICTLANMCIRQKNAFRIVLAGGNTPKTIYALLRRCQTDWSRWQVWFGDERCLPAGDPVRNDSMARTTWLAHVAIPPENIHAIPAQLPATQCISLYSETLHSVSQFDLVLLGLGEDGHTASLFPGHEHGAADNAPAILAVTGAPKPPAARISLSAKRLGAADHVWFVVAGNNKEQAIARWQQGENIPAAAIRPAAGVDVFIAP